MTMDNSEFPNINQLKNMLYLKIMKLEKVKAMIREQMMVRNKRRWSKNKKKLD
jgi:hypothetical protein